MMKKLDDNEVIIIDLWQKSIVEVEHLLSADTKKVLEDARKFDLGEERLAALIKAIIDETGIAIQARRKPRVQ